MQTCSEITAEWITRSEPWSEQRQDCEDPDEPEAEAGPGIPCESSPKEWRRHGGLDYVTRDSTPRASGCCREARYTVHPRTGRRRDEGARPYRRDSSAARARPSPHSDRRVERRRARR